MDASFLFLHLLRLLRPLPILPTMAPALRKAQNPTNCYPFPLVQPLTLLPLPFAPQNPASS